MKNRFDETVSLREREFYILSVAGTITNLIGLTVSLVQGAPLIGKLVVGFGALVMFLCTVYGYRTRKIECMFNIMLITINLFEFPIMFLVLSGLDGGICNYFIMGLMLTAMLMKTKGKSILIITILIIDCIVMIYEAGGQNGFSLIGLKPDYYEKVVSYIIVGALIIIVSIVTEKEHERQNRTIMNLNRELQHQSQLDPLTRIYNRRYLMEYLNKMIEQNNSEFVLAMIDIDNFKSINDQYGHLFGDEVLIKLSVFLKDEVGKQGIVARFGGEEFTVVLNTGEISHLEECLKNAGRQLLTFSQKSYGINITFSGGIQKYENLQEITQLFHLADEKLYHAKHRGKNQIVVS